MHNTVIYSIVIVTFALFQSFVESASSPVLLQSPSIKSESPKPSMALHTPPVPSLLATDLPSLSPFVQNSAIQTTPVHNIKTPQTQEKSNLIEFSLSPLQDSKLEAPSKSNSNYSSDGSTTPEPSPLSQQPTSEDQHTPSTVNSSNDQDSTPSLQHNTSVASSSRKVAFSIEGVAPASMSSQLGLFSPGSLHQTGLSFQTPPSGSYQLMSELPPTPFQDANFDLDSSSNEEEEEEEEQQQLSRESGSSFDSSYFRQLHQRVLPLISQEDIEGSSDHKLEGVVSRTDREEPQAKLVPTDSQPPKNCHDRGVLDSANSLKVDDLLGLNSPGTSQLLSPQVGLLVDTPGSNILGKPLLTSTVQGNQEVSTTSQEQRGQVPSPTSDILLPYLPSHSGTQSGALISASSVDTECTWSSLMNTSKYNNNIMLVTHCS